MILAFGLNAQTFNPNYDSTFAKRIGADDYGMKKYVLVILKTGAYNPQNKGTRDSLFAGHMKNINRLVKENKLIVAGPLGKNERTYRGIFIFNVPTIKEAEELTNSDPAVKAKLFDVELYEWYGSAALGEYLNFEDKIWKVRR